MTKEQVLSGLEFKLHSSSIINYKVRDEYLSRIISSGVTNSENFEATVEKIGIKTISFYTYVIGKRISIKLYYKDLILA